MPPQPLETRTPLAPLLAFVAAYIGLDWASYISPLGHLNVTPWNPAPALGLLFIIRHGRVAVLATFAAIVASEVLVRDTPGGLPTTLWLGVILTAGYAAVAVLLRRCFADGGLFNDRSGLLAWSLIVIAGSLVNSLLFISQLLITGLLPTADWGSAVMRFWIGDAVGIFIALPLLWWLQDAPRREQFGAVILRWETAAYVALALFTLWIALIPGAQASYRYFYLLFLPLVWAASRHGMVGAIFCVTLLQLGMLAGGTLRDADDISLFELQMRAFLLALVGFLIGIAVDEQRRAAAELRHSLRLAAAGEMAGALAHELNQPLTALAAYGSACEQLLRRGDDDELLHDTIRKMIVAADRAATVMRRLRDFFRTGATQLEHIPLGALIATAAAPFKEQASASGIDFEIGPLADTTLHADRLQLEVVLRNLLANAFEAVATSGVTNPRVRLTAEEDGGRVFIDVTDNGPGLSPAMAEQAFEPFISTKSSGLGLGLAISRAIAEAHGGTLTAPLAGHGCFRLLLPSEPRNRNSHG